MFAARKAYENVVFFAFLYVNLVSVGKPSPQFANGSFGNRDEPLLSAFARYLYESLFQIKVGNKQVAQFAYAQSATVKSFDDGSVALSFALAHVYGIYQRINLL